MPEDSQAGISALYGENIPRCAIRTDKTVETQEDWLVLTQLIFYVKIILSQFV